MVIHPSYPPSAYLLHCNLRPLVCHRSLCDTFTLKRYHAANEKLNYALCYHHQN